LPSELVAGVGGLFAVRHVVLAVHAVAVPIDVQIPGALVNAITVVVAVATSVRCARVDVVGVVIAVARQTGVVSSRISALRQGPVPHTVTILVAVGIPGRRMNVAVVVVCGTVAVIVHAIAVLHGLRIDVTRCVIAVFVVLYVALGRGAGFERHVGVAETVAIGVHIPGGEGQALVDLTITVVVLAVARLAGACVGFRIPVVVIARLRYVALGLGAGLHRLLLRAITVAVCVLIPGQGSYEVIVFFIHQVVVVVVQAIADLSVPGMRIGVAVVGIHGVADAALRGLAIVVPGVVFIAVAVSVFVHPACVMAPAGVAALLIGAPRAGRAMGQDQDEQSPGRGEGRAVRSAMHFGLQQ